MGLLTPKSKAWTYKGDFNPQGQYHGRGVLALQNGDEYQGEFQNGLFHGDGLLTTASGEQRIGTWHEGEPQITHEIEPEAIEDKDALEAALQLSDRDSSHSSGPEDVN